MNIRNNRVCFVFDNNDRDVDGDDYCDGELDGEVESHAWCYMVTVMMANLLVQHPLISDYEVVVKIRGRGRKSFKLSSQMANCDKPQ